MKLLTKRLLAVAITVAMTIGMAFSAMAIDNISDANLESVGLDPDKAVIVYGWIDIQDKDAADADGASDEADVEYVTANTDGTYTIDFSAHATSEYTNYAMVHNYESSGNQEIVKGTKMTVSSLSPFCLVGEPKDAAADDDDDDDDSSSSSSSRSSSSRSSSSRSSSSSSSSSRSSSSRSSSSRSSSSSSSSSKKSPKTGMNDSWMLWLMAAGVFAGASVVAYNRKKG